jgi:DNA modification methylase
MAGSHTTSAVSKQEGRKFLGIEKNWRYFKHGKERVKNAEIRSEPKLINKYF